MPYFHGIGKLRSGPARPHSMLDPKARTSDQPAVSIARDTLVHSQPHCFLSAQYMSGVLESMQHVSGAAL
jgi:hypothetical protein